MDTRKNNLSAFHVATERKSSAKRQFAVYRVKHLTQLFHTRLLSASATCCYKRLHITAHVYLLQFLPHSLSVLSNTCSQRLVSY